MHYTTLSQRERAQYFDSFVSSALEVAAHPEVSQALGWMGLEQIVEVLENSFLPNIQGSKLVVPKSQKDEDTLAVLPLDHAHLRTPEAVLTKSEESQRFTETYTVGERYSSRYDYTFTGLFSEDAAGTTLLTDDMWAITYTMWDTKQTKVLERTRPWIIAHPELFECQTPFIGALAMHEVVHCQDTYDDGPLMLTEHYIASSELRAYHTGSVILEAYGIKDSLKVVELARLKDVDNASPFVPSNDLFQWMKAEKLVA